MVKFGASSRRYDVDVDCDDDDNGDETLMLSGATTGDNGRNVTASRICGHMPFFFLASATAGDNVLAAALDQDMMAMSPPPVLSSFVVIDFSFA
jgi:hypothetical protein